MSTTEASRDTEGTRSVDLRLEVVVIPVTDVDRSKAFYGGLGWRLDADLSADNGFRLVQFTPPGSGCSVQFGTNVTSAAPGSAQGQYLIVSDIEAARSELAQLGADVSEVFHPGTPGAQFQSDGTPGRVNGPDPDRPSYRTFASFRDPDGNMLEIYCDTRQESDGASQWRGENRTLAPSRIIAELGIKER